MKWKTLPILQIFGTLIYIIMSYLTLSTRQAWADDIRNVTHFVKNVKIVEFHYHIWNHHEKCIQISTNMPDIDGLEICEISRILRNQTILYGWWSETNGRVQSIKLMISGETTDALFAFINQIAYCFIIIIYIFNLKLVHINHGRGPITTYSNYRYRLWSYFPNLKH